MNELELEIKFLCRLSDLFGSPFCLLSRTNAQGRTFSKGREAEDCKLVNMDVNNAVFKIL